MDFTNAQHSELPSHLNVRQAAQILQYSPNAVYDKLRRNQLPGARKIGGTWRISRAALEEFFNGK